MKRKWFGIRISISICAALGFWGFLYPELALTPDTVKVMELSEDGEILTTDRDWEFGSGLYWELLSAGPEKITFRSRLLTDFSAVLEVFHGGNQ